MRGWHICWYGGMGGLDKHMASTYPLNRPLSLRRWEGGGEMALVGAGFPGWCAFDWLCAGFAGCRGDACELPGVGQCAGWADRFCTVAGYVLRGLRGVQVDASQSSSQAKCLSCVRKEKQRIGTLLLSRPLAASSSHLCGWFPYKGRRQWTKSIANIIYRRTRLSGRTRLRRR